MSAFIMSSFIDDLVRQQVSYQRQEKRHQRQEKRHQCQRGIDEANGSVLPSLQPWAASCWGYDALQALSGSVQDLARLLDQVDAVVVGIGAGMSSAAGLSYTGERFKKYFADFRSAYGIRDMYSGGFYPFPNLETYWAWWSRHILINRFDAPVGKPYLQLVELLQNLLESGVEYFAITTNVDHQLQRAGIDKARLFYTQGDYGLLQCSRACTPETYDNEQVVRAMVNEQHNLRVPSELVPRCPHCGAPMAPNLRADDTFVEDAGWHQACNAYVDFLVRHEHDRVLYWELGVGDNTPVIIKYPFWIMTAENPQAHYATVNVASPFAPAEIVNRSCGIQGDIANVMDDLIEAMAH